MIRYLLALLALVASPVAAQQWTVGPQPVDWTQNTLGDGTARGGTPPYVLNNEPAKIASNFDTAPWISTSGVIFNNTSNGQIKARFNCSFSHSNQADPILMPGMAGGPHLHNWAGNTLGDQNSTYTSLRTTGYGTCGGGPVNRTAYWEAEVCKGPKTAMVCLRPDLLNVYYEMEKSESLLNTRIPRNLRFILGFNPYDPTNSARNAENAPGFDAPYNGFAGWTCRMPDQTAINTDAGSVYSDGFKTASGADPWGGRCKAGYLLTTIISAPACWDGVNATSPNGRDHMRYARRRQSDNTFQCPNKWFKLPVFVALPRFSLKKDAEYFVDNWYLSSDRMSNDPAQWLRNGTTMHADWFGAWDDTVFETFQRECLNIPTNGQAPSGGAECDFNTISPTQRLISGVSPDANGPSPIVDQRQRNTLPGKQRWWPVVNGSKPMSMIHGR